MSPRALALPVVAVFGWLATACASADRAGPLVLAPAGDRLGPIDAATPFDASELQRLFPGADVVATTGATEGEDYPILAVTRGDQPQLQIRSVDGAVVDSVAIMAGVALVGLDARHGSRFVDVYQNGGPPVCVPGIEEAAGQILCPAPSSASVTLVFSGDYDGPDGQLPPPEVIRGWSVVHIVWTPKRQH